MKKIASKQKKNGRVNRFTIGSLLGATGIAIGSLLWVSFGKGSPISVPAYSVERVIDGDTFVTTEQQHIRVAAVESPEMGVVHPKGDIG